MRSLSAAVGCLPAILGMAGAAQAIPPPRYFPLDLGNTWVYTCEEFPGSEAVVAVTGAADGIYELSFSGATIRVGGTPDAIDIELPEEGFVPYYRFQEDSFLHRDFRGCNDNVTLVAASRDDFAETPAGTFTGCLRLEYRDAHCMDAGTGAEWWAYEVGKVKWVEQSIAGPRTWVLTRFEPGSSSLPFLRGDANGDKTVDLSDAVYILLWLFASGGTPGCLDAADTDDAGDVEITDAIFLLNHLFLGGEAPPPPGARTPGYDPTTDDPYTCGDDPALRCGVTSSSTLPHVSFDVSGNPCSLTLAQAAEGIDFVYRTKIEADVPGVVTSSLDAGRCDRPDASGLAVLEMVSGATERYCLCDTGLCLPETLTVDLLSGVYESTFFWDGRSWEGPSDTNNPKGPPFPPGTYRFTVRAEGTYLDLESRVQPFEVSASWEFQLVE